MQTNVHSHWRIQLATRLAPLYAQHAGVAAVVLTGGVVRGRGDSYSDIDLAVFSQREPTEDERRQIMMHYQGLLGTPVVLGEFVTRNISDHPGDGLWWEEVAYIGENASTGFKIDVNHNTLATMARILDDVLINHDINGFKLEILYSIQRLLILHGESIVISWQTRAADYPDGLRRKLIDHHLAQFNFDVAMHLERGDLHLFYAALAQAQHHIMGALLALNRIYRPELKRLDDLCRELKHAPENLAHRMLHMYRVPPLQVRYKMDTLADDIFVLIESQAPDVDIGHYRTRFYLRRQSFETSPFGH